MEEQRLNINQVLDKGNAIQKVFIAVLPVPVELHMRNRRRLQLINVFHVIMFNRIIHINTFGRVKSQQFLEQIYRQRVSVGKPLLPYVLVITHTQSNLVAQEVVPTVLIINRHQIVLRQLPNKLLNNLELVEVGLALEQRLTRYQLSEHAPHRPQVNRLLVVLVV